MSWGIELWDQYENLSSHSQKGIEFLEKYSQFLKDRSNIETEYAYKLRKLVKNYQPKKKEEEENQFSSCTSFVKTLKEIICIAGQHELIAETFSNEICKEISDLVKELKEERKKHLQDGQKHQSLLQSSKAYLEKNKRAYEKAFKEAEKASESYQKIDADNNFSRADVEKARTLSQMKSSVCEKCKTDYANQLQKTNELQRVHYSDLIPNIFQQLQDMEERRISSVQNFMVRTAATHKKVLPIIQKCLDGIIEAAEAINPKQDSLLAIEKFKSGYDPPDDIPFEDLSNPRSVDHSSSVPYNNNTVRGTLSGVRIHKRGGILNFFSNSKNVVDEIKEDCSDLPPVQQKKKLQQKINAIKNQIQKETDARDGLMKMKCVYEDNRTLGDPVTVENKLADNGVHLEKLQNELQKYETYLAIAEGRVAAVHPHLQEHRTSISEDSLSRSASDSSVSNPNSYPNSKVSAPGTPQQMHGNSNSPESGIGTSHPSITDVETDCYPDPEFESESNEYSDFEPVLGTGKALYPFTGQSEGSVDVCENEEFDVIELDQGDGWTRIRKRDLEEGFVPTSYIETHLYNTC